MRLPLGLIAVGLLFGGQAPAPPDLAIINARVFTGDSAMAWAEAVSGRVVHSARQQP